MASATAWLLEPEAGMSIAVGERELIHLVEHPSLYPALEQPSYARWRFQWRNAQVPIVDLAALIAGRAGQREREPELVGVFAYRAAPDAGTSLGALSLSNVPVRQRVDDQQACNLPPTLKAWAPLSCSCFEHEDVVYPIIELAAVFSRLLPPAEVAGLEGTHPTFQVTEM